MAELNSSSEVVFDIQTVKTFLHFLSITGNESEVFCYCWMNKESTDVIKGYGVRFGTVEDIQNDWHQVGHLGSTLHVTLNQTSDSGRKKKDIQAMRVLCLDLDHVTGKEKIRDIRHCEAPHMIVESSPSKYHIYWKLDGTMNAETWEIVQAGLASKYGGDMAMCTVNKMIRAPGVMRVCKNGDLWMPKIVYLREIIAPIGELGLMDWTLEAGRGALAERKEERRKLRESALKKETAIEIGKLGGRNDSLFTVLYSFVLEGNGNVTPESTLKYAFDLNEEFEAPLDDSEVEKTADSAYARGIAVRNERAKKNLEMLEEARVRLGKEIGATEDFKYDYNTTFLKVSRFSGLASVERVMQRFGTNIVKIGKDIYAFDRVKRTWRNQRGDSAILMGFIKMCAFDMTSETAFLDKCKNSRGELIPGKIEAQLEKYHGSSYLGGVLSVVLAENTIREMEFTDFDKRRELLFCANGVLELTTGVLREAQAEDYLLHRTGVTWDSEAKCPHWEQFVREVFSENEDAEGMCTYLQEVFGYTLTGGVDAQKIFIHVGSGSNGKSNVLKTLKTLLGSYHALMDCNAVTKSKGGFQKELDRVTAKMEGKRAMVLDDLDTGTQWNEGVVKLFTGSTLSTRNLYAEARDIPNRSKLHIGCNEAPKTEGESEGIIRRLSFISYERHFIPDADKERELEANRLEEASGILRWAVEGLQRLARQKWKFSEPAECKMYQEEYRTEEFKVETNFMEIFEPGDGDENDEKNWHKIDVLLEDMRQRLNELGAIGKLPSAVSLQHLLTKKLKIKWIRKRENGVRKRFYFVKRKFCANFIKL